MAKIKLRGQQAVKLNNSSLAIPLKLPCFYKFRFLKRDIMNYVSIFAFLLFTSCVNANTALPANRHISVNGEAQLKAKPDIAVINLEVESLQGSSLDAKKDVDNRINSFLAGISNFNIDQTNVSASTINTQPSYSYSENDKQQLEGYLALFGCTGILQIFATWREAR